MPRPVEVVVLAAGQGTRMKSALPKVLHPVGGMPMLEHVYTAAQQLSPARVHIVFGHGGERVRDALAHLEVGWVEQREQLGTGHAVAQVLPAIREESLVLILYGDVPLIQTDTLRRLLSEASDGDLALLTVRLPEPTGYGRVVRDASGKVVGIVEHKDATEAQRAIDEVNTGLLAVEGARLKRWVGRLDNRNAQGEYYLTDIFAMAVAEGLPVRTVEPAEVAEVQGVNDRVQLAALERHYQRRQARLLMQSGVTLRDPDRFDLRGRLQTGRDVTIDIDVIFEGDVVLGDGVSIGPNVVLRNAHIADGAEIKAMSVIEEATIGAGAHVGPFARIRPGTRLSENAHIGNFVEVKNSEVGAGSKINHLSYIGDSTVGREVNIGAGTITCNYDGANKHRTVIGDRAFIGSDTQLVAPVTVGAGATIGAGSTITREAPAEALTLSRAPQKTVSGWQRPKKQPRKDG